MSANLQIRNATYSSCLHKATIILQGFVDDFRYIPNMDTGIRHVRLMSCCVEILRFGCQALRAVSSPIVINSALSSHTRCSAQSEKWAYLRCGLSAVAVILSHRLFCADSRAINRVNSHTQIINA